MIKKREANIYARKQISFSWWYIPDFSSFLRNSMYENIQVPCYYNFLSSFYETEVALPGSIKWVSESFQSRGIGDTEGFSFGFLAVSHIELWHIVTIIYWLDWNYPAIITTLHMSSITRPHILQNTGDMFLHNHNYVIIVVTPHSILCACIKSTKLLGINM